MEYLLEIQISVYMLKIQILVYVRHTDFCLYVKEGSKEEDNPCRLPVTDVDFCLHVSDIHFCVFFRDSEISVFVGGKLKICESISHSVMSNSLLTPWTVAHQGSSVHGILQARVLE